MGVHVEGQHPAHRDVVPALPSYTTPDDGAEGLVVGRERMPPPDDDEAERLKRLAGVPPDQRADTNGQVLHRVDWTTAREIMAATYPPPRYAVDGIIPEGLTLLVGRPKIGKSWLALGLALAVAAGGRALGTIPVEQGKVALLALEDTPRRLQARLRMLLDGQPVPDGFGVTTAAPRLDVGLLDALDVLDVGSLRLVVVDVLQRIRPQSRSDSVYERDYQAAAALKAWSDRHTVPVVALHHDRKAGADDWVDSVSGSLGLTGAADAIALMRRSRGEADATLHVTGRDVEEAEHALRFDRTRGSWTLLGDAVEWAMSEQRRRIVEAVREHTALKPKQIAEATDLDYEVVRKLVVRMADAGQLDTDGQGTYLPPPPVPSVPSVPTDASPGNAGNAGNDDPQDLAGARAQVDRADLHRTREGGATP